jgi:Lambda phage tail tube protein, TTP
MSNQVTEGYGAKLQYSATMPAPSPSGSWTDIADVVDIKPPKTEAEDIDTSTMVSPQQYKEFVAGWATAGEIECKIHFSKTQNASLFGVFRLMQSWQILFADGSALQAKGYLKTFANEIDREKLVQADITVKISGPPAFVAAP